MSIVSIEAAAANVAERALAKGATPAAKRPEAPKHERTSAPREHAPVTEAPAPTPAAKHVELPEFRHYELSFKLNEERGRVVVQVIDSKTGSVVRTVPPEELLKALRQTADPRGVLLDRET